MVHPRYPLKVLLKWWTFGHLVYALMWLAVPFVLLPTGQSRAEPRVAEEEAEVAVESQPEAVVVAVAAEAVV